MAVRPPSLAATAARRARWVSSKLLPEHLRRGRLTAPVLEVARPDGPARGRAALAYLAPVFLQPESGRFARNHQNARSARRLAAALARSGWIVDAHHHDRGDGGAPTYDLLVGSVPALGRLADAHPSATPILIATTARPDVHMARSRARHERAERSRGGSVPVDLRMPDWAADPGTSRVLGTFSSWSAGTWERPRRTLTTYREAPALTPAVHRRVDGAGGHVLWFGSHGLVHKGLDLALEALAGQVGVTLHVVGPLSPDSTFAQAWAPELAAPNVVVHGWLDVASPRFAEVVRTCRFVLLPSASEAMAGSVVLAAGQGLIPITSVSAAIDLPVDVAVTLDLDADLDTAVGALRAAVLEQVARPSAELEERSRVAHAVVAERHAPAACDASIDHALALLLDARADG